MTKTNINTINNTKTNSNNKGEITMTNTRTNHHGIKTRIIAGILSAITVISASAFMTASASAEAIYMDPTATTDTTVTIGGEEKSYKDFTEAWKEATGADEATIKLNAPQVNGLENLNVPAGKKLTVDLGGGRILTQSVLFTVDKGAECTIKNGTIANAHTAVVANGNVDLIDLTVSYSHDNAVKGGEGARVVIDGCTFRDNKGAQGGAVYLPYYVDGTVIKNSVFDLNEALHGGGAVYTLNSVYNCKFTRNCTFENSGALYMAGNKQDIRDCTFENNNASDNGGAVYLTQDENNINFCTFKNNYSGMNGGAVFTPEEKDANISDCMFQNNTAVSNGGAIYMGYRSLLKLRNTNILNNTSYGKGGGVYLGALRYNDHDFDNVFIMENKAEQGGGVYAEAGLACAADIKLHNRIGIEDNINDDVYLVKDSGKKAEIYTTHSFDAEYSCVYVNSSESDETAVVEMVDENHQIAFRGNAGRELEAGYFTFNTLYIQ